ncbi:TPA: hypothetical protein LTU42_002253 [Listeria monocytogenes]|nr:hypothetical protein [Listeria monocytogenes]HBL8358533.1 hypothetical protein [Listeria monocytogenes]
MNVQVITKSGKIYTNEGTKGTYEGCINNYRQWLVDKEVKVFELVTEKDAILIPVASVEAVHILRTADFNSLKEEK